MGRSCCDLLFRGMPGCRGLLSRRRSVVGAVPDLPDRSCLAAAWRDLCLNGMFWKEGAFRWGEEGIATLNNDGEWVNAVELNKGGKETFVSGPWKPQYGLGTYGIDTSTGTVREGHLPPSVRRVALDRAMSPV